MVDMFQDFKTEIKLFLIVAFVAVSVGGILLVKSSQQPLVFPQEPKIVSGDIQVEPKDQMCTTDIDCERIWTDCAGCSCGAAVNKGQVERYQISKGEICKDYNGPVCEFYCETPSPRCVNNKCILSSKKYAEKIAAWKTYRNEEYGFEVQYPADITKNVNTIPREENVLFFGNMKVLFQSELFNTATKAYNPSFSIAYSALPIDEFREKEIEYDTHFGYATPDFIAIVSEARHGYRFESGALNMGILCVSDQAIIEVQDGTLNLRYSECGEAGPGDELSETRKQIFSKILSTFRFVDDGIE